MAALITFPKVVSIATEHDVSGMFGIWRLSFAIVTPRVAIFGKAWRQAFWWRAWSPMAASSPRKISAKKY
jgi:hypothetical protein